MNMNYKKFDALPEPLRLVSDRYLERLKEKAAKPVAEQLSDIEYDRLRLLLGLSDFIAETLISHPEWLTDCLQISNARNDIAQSKDNDSVVDKEILRRQLNEVTEEAHLHSTLRQYRNRRMMQIAAYDLLNEQQIEDSLTQVSQLADALIMEGYHWLYRWFCKKYSKPQGPLGEQNLLIIGMGKLGGGELNFSSDIDLIFVYPKKGEITYRKKNMEHQQFFIKLAQKLIAALHQTTIDGQVFRVDMRLRPFGDSGPLVTSFAALEDYYQEQGREWERYAMVKGRVLNQDDPYASELQQILQPFVFRRYIDYSVLDSLRKMKQMIRQEVRRRHLHNNIKLGSGGIREIEFILQCIQLTRGGKDKDVQEKNVLKLMGILHQGDIFPEKELQQLKQNYLYFRKVEHCLQQFSDQQTQELPGTEEGQLRLCHVMQKDDFHACLEDIKQRTHFVSNEFENLIGDAPKETLEEAYALNDFWLLDLTEEEAVPLIREVYDTEGTRDVTKLLMQFKTEFKRKPIGVRGKESLDHLIPLLFKACLAYQALTILEMEQLLHRVMNVIKSILRRTAYLELLLENRPAMLNLIQLCSMSDWVAQQLARFPLLLDELLNPAALNNPTPVEQYPDLLRQQLLRIPEEDLEQQMESLRQFKLSHQLRIAAADLFGALPVMKVSDHLTWLAETLIQESVNSAWRQMIEKYGYPKDASDEDTLFMVVGYGKLGGLELGYSSDLDLVFLHDCNSNADTSGPKHIESRQFYAKLAQRIMHLFNTKTSSGELYEIDLRLRPSGNSGLLVSLIDSFKEYQTNEAWTWEHQALVRSRVIYGSHSLREKFDEIRKELLCQPRDKHALRDEVVEMRDKMRQHLDKSHADKIDLKQGRGAMTDIEFLTQYWTLRHANENPGVVTWSDNVRIIETLVSESLISEHWSEPLTSAYLKIRNLSHRKALEGTPNLLNDSELQTERQNIVKIWQAVFEE